MQDRQGFRSPDEEFRAGHRTRRARPPSRPPAQPHVAPRPRRRLGAVAHQAERAVLIPVGATLEARDRVTDAVRTYTDTRLTRQELNRFERRGAKALGRTRRTAERQA